MPLQPQEFQQRARNHICPLLRCLASPAQGVQKSTPSEVHRWTCRSNGEPTLGASGPNELPVVVAVLAVRVMEMPVHQIVDVIPVRHGLVTAIRAVDVRGVMPLARVIRGAFRGVRPADLEPVLIHVIPVGMVQVAVVQVVHVVVVLDGHVAAVRAVLVIVVAVFLAAHLRFPPHWRARARL